MMGSLARTLMKKSVGIAGDGTAELQLIILGSVDYDPLTGDITRSDSTHSLGRAIVGVVSEAEVSRHQLESTTHKAVLAMLDYEASGAPQLPKTSDSILLDGTPWIVDKVIKGSMKQSLIFYVCETS